MEEKLLLRDHMRCTRLIQRLEKPIGRASPFSFGGGLKNGGLSKEAMDVLGDIFNFDYMGSSEFEWGAVPAALNFIAEQSSLKTIVSGETQGVFYICPQSYETGVIAVIKALLDGAGYPTESITLMNIIRTKLVGWSWITASSFLSTRTCSKRQKLFSKCHNKICFTHPSSGGFFLVLKYLLSN
ncbi:MAG: hypothetical protein UV32_C0003G0012 [Candidatus Collierbacteria bacterium GW2011_GWF2_42_51]|nr:MAG: hypothetical protein UV32_C0003G0012 [Candidatus Collierbacteria bacterium GW2011_GWF2_42_51]